MALKDIVRNIQDAPKVKSLSEVIDNFIVQRESKPNDHSYGWHPSSFCDMCIRHKVISDIVEEKKANNFSEKLYRIFDVGSSLHRWYQEEYLGPSGILWGKWRCSRCHMYVWGFMPSIKCSCEESQRTPLCLKFCTDFSRSSSSSEATYLPEKMQNRGGCVHCGKWGKWEFREVPFRLDAEGLSEPILGHCDGVLILPSGVLLEAKTINSFGFAGLFAPRRAHVLQGQAYAELLRRKAVPGCTRPLPEAKKILIFYIGKNTSDEKEFWIDVDRDVGSAVLEIPFQVEAAHKSKTLPDKHSECEEDEKCRRVKKCSVKKFCFAKRVSYKSLTLYGEKYGR